MFSPPFAGAACSDLMIAQFPPLKNAPGPGSRIRRCLTLIQK
jgi:hypothetical protein